MNSIEFEKDTKSEVKGRNGYFKPASCIGYDYAENAAAFGYQYCIAIASKRHGDMAPVTLNLTTEDAIKLRDFLVNLVKEAEA